MRLMYYARTGLVRSYKNTETQYLTQFHIRGQHMTSIVCERCYKYIEATVCLEIISCVIYYSEFSVRDPTLPLYSMPILMQITCLYRHVIIRWKVHPTFPVTLFYLAG